MNECRFCGKPLTHVFVDLGEAPPSNSFLTKEQLNRPEEKLSLKVFVCDNCFLVQLPEHKSAVEIFNEEYAYLSSISTSWLQHCSDYTDEMIRRFRFNEHQRVIEIASNDGYLLQFFQKKNIPVLGIEPAANTAAKATEKGINTMVAYFDSAVAQKLKEENLTADLLIGNNVLAHVPSLNDFVRGMKIILKPSGIITMEFPHLYHLVKEHQFDTIYHEHYSYFSFYTVKEIFEKHGLKLFDVEELPTHGGSLRIYAAHEENGNRIASNRVEQLLEKESKAGMQGLEYYQQFQPSIDSIKDKLLEFLRGQKMNGKKVAAYGAAAKGNTLLNYCGIHDDLIAFVADRSPFKQGKFLPGSHIPVTSEQEFFSYKPDYILILPWNIQEEITTQLKYAHGWGCRFVIAIPELRIL
ncbi:MAG TPA: class I SAM-dependent methyltransferase [Chitinophagales bacterium]|nr:class I SAM-dependent methyltransferase [Chitinophagales bacterium]